MSSLQTESVYSKILERGYWRIVIRPIRFIENRIPDYTSLFPLVDRNAVRWRILSYPYVRQNEPRRRGRDWISQEIDQDWYLEMWRLYQSGQFFHAFGIVEDWRDQSKIQPADNEWKPGTELGLEYTIVRFTEIFEFAARLSSTDAGDDFLHIEIKLSGLDGRRVKPSTHEALLHLTATDPASIQEFSRGVDLSRTDLIAGSNDLALDAATELFQRFGWNPPRAVLREIQSRILPS